MLSAKEYNIILLGETGTGKSLFINSASNYIQFENLQHAIESKDRVSLISSKFKVTDSNDVDHVIEAGENDGNERAEVGESLTINSMSYKFQFGDVFVRLIDTPGVGDTKGEQADTKNISNILSFINNYENLHAIGIVMKSSDNKMTDRFSYCLKMLLNNLSRTAVDNVIFILTNSNNFKPGPVKGVLERFNDIELPIGATLKLDKNHIYCFENQSYEYVMAIHRNVMFDEEDLERQRSNWKRSSKEIKRLGKFVSELSPYKVRETMSLNDARQFIKIINPFLPIVLRNINENTLLVNNYKKELQMTGENIKNIKCDDSFRQIDINIVAIERAITFCTSAKCREVVEVGVEEKYHYPKQCCEGCIVINSWRWWCEAIAWNGYCKVCECHKDEHDRRFYKTVKSNSNMLTAEGLSRITMAVEWIEQVKIAMELLREKKAQLLLEKKVMEDAEKKFTKFLRVHELVKPPKRKCDVGESSGFLKCAEKYEKDIEMTECISIEEFYQLKAMLVNLPLNGHTIRDILNANCKGLSAYVRAKETVQSYINKFEDFFFS